MKTILKQCKKCKIDRPTTDFRFQKSSRDKLGSYCRECADEYSKNHYKQNKKKRIEQITTWNTAHEDLTKKYKKGWYQKTAQE